MLESNDRVYRAILAQAGPRGVLITSHFAVPRPALSTSDWDRDVHAPQSQSAGVFAQAPRPTNHDCSPIRPPHRRHQRSSGVRLDRANKREPCWSTAPPRRRCALPTILTPLVTISSGSGSVKHNKRSFLVNVEPPGRYSPRRAAEIPQVRRAVRDRRVHRAIQLGAGPRQRMVGRDDQRVGHFVVVPDRAAARQAPHHRDRLESRIGPGLGQVAENSRGSGSGSSSRRCADKPCRPPAGHRFEQGLVQSPCSPGRRRPRRAVRGKSSRRSISSSRYVHESPPTHSRYVDSIARDEASGTPRPRSERRPGTRILPG